MENIESYSFFNSSKGDRVYNAHHWADYFRPLYHTGVFNGDLQVIAGGGMTVTINGGYAWIDGDGYHLKDARTFDIETASGNMNRIDNIILRLDLTNRWIRSFVVTGGYYQGNATAPEPDRSATVYEIVLARIKIDAGTTAITQDLITDTRMDDTLCGWVCGSVDQIKFEQIKAQFDAFFAKYQSNIVKEYTLYMGRIEAFGQQAQEQYNKINADFEEWLETIKGKLNEADAARLQNEIDVLISRTGAAESALENTLKRSDMIASLAINVDGKVMDGKTCAEGINKAIGTVLTATLAAGATTLTFTDAAITDDSLIDIYINTDHADVAPSKIVQSGNTLTLTFDKQKTAVGVKVKVI
mgnify:CR=1 FL=1